MGELLMGCLSVKGRDRLGGGPGLRWSDSKLWFLHFLSFHLQSAWGLKGSVNGGWWLLSEGGRRCVCFCFAF